MPADADALRAALADVWSRSAIQRVEIACRGERGRTGTALACLAIIDGVSSGNAVDVVRERYDRRAADPAPVLRHPLAPRSAVTTRHLPLEVTATATDAEGGAANDRN